MCLSLCFSIACFFIFIFALIRLCLFSSLWHARARSYFTIVFICLQMPQCAHCSQYSFLWRAIVQWQSESMINGFFSHAFGGIGPLWKHQKAAAASAAIVSSILAMLFIYFVFFVHLAIGSHFLVSFRFVRCSFWQSHVCSALANKNGTRVPSHSVASATEIKHKRKKISAINQNGNNSFSLLRVIIFRFSLSLAFRLRYIFRVILGVCYMCSKTFEECATSNEKREKTTTKEHWEIFKQTHLSGCNDPFGQTDGPIHNEADLKANKSTQRKKIDSSRSELLTLSSKEAAAASY